jgi:hypothetical protein
MANLWREIKMFSEVQGPREEWMDEPEDILNFEWI